MPTDSPGAGEHHQIYGGLREVTDEMERLRASATAEVQRRSHKFWAEFEQKRDPQMLIAWFIPRCWREIDYVFMLGEEIRRYGLSFERRHITALSKQLYQEAEHYESVGRIIERLGGNAPTEPPLSARPWSEFLWQCLDRHRLSAIAAWYMSETAATGTFEGIMDGGRRYELPDVVRTYEGIIKDEKFHLGLGRVIIERYTENADDVEEVMRSLRRMADLVTASHTAIDLYDDRVGG
ncbi:MAG: hypothetical protein E6H04_02465 [Bacillati bacterium ANGP1]|uniref:Ferritin-like domain-containing protein n=1 Tax=Candidatus Segetimicrobium genomatis TaxID=2569760 RepID=A0A537JJP5_9BACT|nr:MAG: hypothetical protein E6H04_02465 [Terrabacteria group bacterium ANGP1]